MNRILDVVGAVLSDVSRACCKKLCARLLTLEKSVTSFRPSRRLLRNQVSKYIATVDSTSPDFTAGDCRWMQWPRLLRGCRTFFSQTSTVEPAVLRAAGFFMDTRTSITDAAKLACMGTASVPVRLARRRSIAGPIPAASCVTGLYRNTH